MCEGDFTPIPDDRNEDQDVVVAEAAATPSTSGVAAAPELLA
jgi:hypothetical protein